jgi:hypothetical protein
MNAILKSFSTVALPVTFLILSSSVLIAQDAGAKKKSNTLSPVGTWNWEQKAGDSKIKSQLTVVKKGDQYTGKYKDKDRNLDIKNAKLKDGTFSFEVVPHQEKPELAIKFAGKLSADKITGTMKYTINDEPKSVAWVAKREDPFKAVLGKWFLEFETPDGQALEFTIEVKKKGKGLGVAFVDDESVKIRKVKFKNGLLSFDTEQTYQEQPLTVEWDLTIDGNLVTGTLFYSFDNDEAAQGEIDVDGERVK